MSIYDYEPIVGPQAIEELRILGRKLVGGRILNINSTAVGGGVAEILNRMIPLLKELGVDTTWRCVTGGEQFFRVEVSLEDYIVRVVLGFELPLLFLLSI